MEDKQYDVIDVDITEMNRHILQFCGGILTHFQDVLNNREKEICKYLLEGRSRKWISDTFMISNERIRQIFFKSIKKINKAYEQSLIKTEKIINENENLKHRNFVLEKELLSSQAKENVKDFFLHDKKLCENAIRLLDVPVKDLPLTVRAIKVLESANALTFKEIPLLTIEQLYQIKKCGKKTIHDILTYLANFGLEFGMLYDEVVTRLSKLSNNDITSEIFDAYRAKIAPIVISQYVPTVEEIENITLSQFCAEMGRGKKAKKKWGGLVKRILLANQIDTLDKFLAMKPSEFMALKGVGPTTLKYARMAFDHFGLMWEDNPNEK